MSIASKIAGLHVIIKATIMFGYERMWANIHGGKDFWTELGGEPRGNRIGDIGQKAKLDCDAIVLVME
jgi:hypothetical protein